MYLGFYQNISADRSRPPIRTPLDDTRYLPVVGFRQRMGEMLASTGDLLKVCKGRPVDERAPLHDVSFELEETRAEAGGTPPPFPEHVERAVLEMLTRRRALMVHIGEQDSLALLPPVPARTPPDPGLARAAVMGVLQKCLEHRLGGEEPETHLRFEVDHERRLSRYVVQSGSQVRFGVSQLAKALSKAREGSVRACFRPLVSSSHDSHLQRGEAAPAALILFRKGTGHRTCLYSRLYNWTCLYN